MAVPLTSSSASNYVLHHLLRPSPPQPPPLICLFFRPLCASAATTSTATKAILSKSHKTQLQQTRTAFFPFLSSLSTSTFLSSSNSLSFLLKAHNHSLSLEQEIEEDQQEQVEKDDFCNGLNEDEDEVEDTESGSEISDFEDGGAVVGNDDKGSVEEGLKKNGVKVPTLTVKEKKELASYAHGLGKKLKSQLVGKSGVTDNVASSFIETLEANELLKIKIHRTCPGELDDVVQRLEEATGSVVVGQIGRTVIIYRPSLSKMKAEEKKKRARRVFMRKEPKLKSLSQPREHVPRRLLGHGRRRSSST